MYKKIKKNIGETLKKEVNEYIQNIKTQSLQEVPYDTGALHDSFYIDINGEENGKIEFNNSRLKATVGYKEDYALVQHEAVGYKRTKPGTKSKYLSDPFEENMPKFKNSLEQSLKGAIKK